MTGLFDDVLGQKNGGGVEAAAAVRWCPVDNPQRVERSSRLLAWSEAKELRLVQDAEQTYASRGLGLPWTSNMKSIRTRTPRSFRWMIRMSRQGLFFVAIDGDVGAVYPGLTHDALMADSSALAKYFSTETLGEMAGIASNVVDGLDNGGDVLTWHSLPELNFVIQVEIHEVMRYLDITGEIVAIQSGETRDVTQSMHDYASVISKVMSDHRETVDHRLGNKLRLMHLLCQEGRNDDLNEAFERMRYEVEIRRKLFDNLPPIEPISAEDWIKPEFQNLSVEMDCPADKQMLFFSRKGVPLSPIVLQVLVLQDCASNAFKHGNGSVSVVITSTEITFTNPDRGVATPGRHIGLGALRHACSQLDVGIDFLHRKGVEFAMILRVNVEFVDLDRPGAALAPRPRDEDRRMNEWNWILVDDDAVICRKYQLLVKKMFGIDLKIIHNPADVANLVKIVVYATKFAANRRPTVLILDEMLLEIDDALDMVTVTGTELRDRLFACPVTRDSIIAAKSLFLVSASASRVEDDRVILKLGKTGAVASDMRRIFDTIVAAPPAPP